MVNIKESGKNENFQKSDFLTKLEKNEKVLPYESNFEENKYQLTQIDKNEIFDLTIKQIGGFGWSQKIIWCIGLLSCFIAAFNHLGIIFIAFSPEYRCHDQDLDNEIFKNETGNITDFQDVIQDEKCKTRQGLQCKKWIYNQSLFTSTVVSQFDLVCERLPLLPLIISSYMIGIILNSFLGGILSDRFGRKRMCLIYSLIHISSSFATAFANSYSMFLGFHILVGSSIHSVWSCLFVLSAEMMPEPMRVANGAVFNFGWNFGAIAMVLLAYLIRDWSHLQLSFAISSLGLVSIYFLVPESPRWLLSQGHFELAEKNLKLIGQRNRVDISSQKLNLLLDLLRENHLKETGTETKENRNNFVFQALRNIHSKTMELISNKEFCKRLALLSFAWFAVGCGSYGIHFSVKLVNFNIFIITAIKELVVGITIILLVPLYGRMHRCCCILLFYMIAGLLGVSFLFIPEDAIEARTVVFILCQAQMCGAFYLIIAYTPDVFSTDTRNFAFAFLDSISKIGTTICPFIVDLGGHYNASLPPMVFGILMILSSLVFICTPNTRGHALVQNVNELNCFKNETLLHQFKQKITK